MSNKRGFTLLELAIAMVVAGILAGGGIALFRAATSSRLRAETVEYMEEVKGALRAYARENYTLPFADTDGDGWQNNTDFAVVPEGFLPYRTLGIRGTDAWGRKLKYRVNPRLVVPPYAYYGPENSCTTLKEVISGNYDYVTNPWVPEVWDQDAGRAFPVAAVIISAGASDADLLDYDPDPSVNEHSKFDATAGGDNHAGNPYVRARQSANFDDLVLYIGEHTLFDWIRSKGINVSGFPAFCK